jgi:hypothetical protein
LEGLHFEMQIIADAADMEFLRHFSLALFLKQ